MEITTKTPREIIDKCKEMIHRHRRRFIHRNLSPCPCNCKKARVTSGHKVSGCSGCNSSNPNFCKNHENFIPLFSKEELAEQFRQDIHNPETLLQNYRDLVVFFFGASTYLT